MASWLSGGTLRTLMSSLGLRGIALGGRFVFALFAVKYMLAEDFGRFGLLAGLAILIPTVVGMEAYQVLLRRVLQEPEEVAAHTRRFYATWTLSGSLLTGLAGALTLVCFRWSAVEVALGALVLMLEHLGLDIVRILVAEQRPALAMLSLALRNGAWGVMVPLLYFAGLFPAPWRLEVVLCAWIAGGIAANLAVFPVFHRFRPRRRDVTLRQGIATLRELGGKSRNWVVFTGSLRVIETGGRFVCAWMISEAAAGRFTFLSMFASLSYLAFKAGVEPLYYPRLMLPEVSEATRREFLRVTLISIAGATACAVLGLALSVRINGAPLPVSELVSFGLLCLAFGSLSMTQPAHYRLYRSHQDRAIMATGLAACVAMIVSSVIATKVWALPGAALGTLIGAATLLALKSHAARKLSAGADGEPG